MILHKYKSYFDDVCLYIINRYRAGASNEELLNELVTNYKFEVFAHLPESKLRDYLEILVEYTKICYDVCSKE